MQVRVGPLDAAEMDGWLRFARRVLCDLRTEPGDMDSRYAASLLMEWCALIDSWNNVLLSHSSDSNHFVWEESLELSGYRTAGLIFEDHEGSRPTP